MYLIAGAKTLSLSLSLSGDWGRRGVFKFSEQLPQSFSLSALKTRLKLSVCVNILVTTR